MTITKKHTKHRPTTTQNHTIIHKSLNTHIRIKQTHTQIKQTKQITEQSHTRIIHKSHKNTFFYKKKHTTTRKQTKAYKHIKQINTKQTTIIHNNKNKHTHTQITRTQMKTNKQRKDITHRNYTKSYTILHFAFNTSHIYTNQPTLIHTHMYTHHTQQNHTQSYTTHTNSDYGQHISCTTTQITRQPAYETKIKQQTSNRHTLHKM